MITDTRYTIELLDRQNRLIDEIIANNESDYENTLYAVFGDSNVDAVHITKTDFYDDFHCETTYKTIAA